jgi:purine-nucleoside phosphorylase
MPTNFSMDPFFSAPVSHILPDDLSERVILCSGEVEADLLHAFRYLKVQPEREGQYRCYKYWKYADFTLILAGIGIGTLEPLLWEILTVDVIRKIVLIGTAGGVTEHAPRMGDACFITEAWPCGTSIDAEVGLNSVTPRWSGARCGASCTIASSDFFYGYSDRVLDGTFAACQGPFKTRYQLVKSRADMIDMEVAGFYYLAPHFDKTGSLEFAAVKGSSNGLGKGEEMNSYAAEVMDNCARQALEMLELGTLTR